MITRLDAEAQLPLLPEIPSHGVCRIEGYNGIGKSLTVRLLMLCAGVQPYSGQQALWTGFCAGIGRVRVEASELADDRTVSWELDTRTLPQDIDGEASRPTTEWFRTVKIDGRGARLDEVVALFEVKQIRANEGLLETLADDLDGAANDVRMFFRRLEERTPLAEVERRTSELLQLLTRVDADHARSRRETVAQTARELTEAESEVSAALTRLRDVEKAMDLAARVEQLAHDKPKLVEELAEVQDEIETTRQRRERLQDELEALEVSLAEGEEAKAAMDRARTTQKSASTRFLNASERLVTALQKSNLSAAEDAALAEQDLRDRIEALEALRLELDASPAVVALNADLRGRLHRADLEGIGAQLVADLSGRTYSVRELDNGLRDRSAAIAATPSSPSTVEIDRRLLDAQQRLVIVESIPRLLEASEEARRRKESADQKLADLTVASSAADMTRMNELRDERVSIDEKVYNLAARRVILGRQIEEIGTAKHLEATRTALGEMLERLEVDPLGLGEERARTDTKLNSARAVQQRAKSAHQDAAVGASRTDDEVADVVSELRSGSSLRWLRDSVGQHIPTVNDGFDRQLECITSLAGLTKKLDGRLGQFRQSFRSVPVALTAEAESLRGGQPTAQAFRVEAASWAQRRAEEWFAEESVRRVLIGDVSDVSVHLSRRVVSWADGAGVEHAIPLQGFSSGQAVFAYTEAQLLRLGREASTSVNRLVVIDEFGAFVARDRLDELRKTLLTWQTRHPSDQILLILPLSQDYQSLAGSAVGARADELDAIVASLQRVGYYAESFAA